jgi:hypothetical protein
MLPYSYRDADGDQHTRPESGSVCSGKALPAGYTTVPSGLDCDDTNPLVYDDVLLYADADGDGVGAGTGADQCIGATLPDLFSDVGGDCAPSDKLRYYWAAYAYVDRDGDGATVPEQGQICGDGSLAPPYFTTAAGLDCDDGNASLDHYGPLYADLDGDGFGAGPALVMCLGKSNPTGYSQFGTDADDATSAVTEELDDVLDTILY